MGSESKSGVLDTGEITTLLRAWARGNRVALDKLTPIVYDELRRLARQYIKSERAGHTLQTTALVNEAYLRLVDCEGMQWRAAPTSSLFPLR